MKYVKLETFGQMKTADVVTIVMRHAPNGCAFAEMVDRLAVLKAVETTLPYMVLKPAEYDFLKRTVEGFSGWNVVSQELVDCIAAIGDASSKAPVTAVAAE